MNLSTNLPLLPLTEENVRRFEELTKHQAGPVDMGFNLKGEKTEKLSQSFNSRHVGKSQSPVKASQKDLKSVKVGAEWFRNPKSVKATTIVKMHSLRRSDKKPQEEPNQD